MTLSSKWKVKIFTTSLIKSWSYQFLSLIDLKGIKKFIIASAKIFWPWRPGRLQSGCEHFTWFWLYLYTFWLGRLNKGQAEGDGSSYYKQSNSELHLGLMLEYLKGKGLNSTSEWWLRWGIHMTKQLLGCSHFRNHLCHRWARGGAGGYPLLKKKYDPPSLQNHPHPLRNEFKKIVNPPPAPPWKIFYDPPLAKKFMTPLAKKFMTPLAPKSLLTYASFNNLNNFFWSGLYLPGLSGESCLRFNNIIKLSISVCFFRSKCFRPHQHIIYWSDTNFRIFLQNHDHMFVAAFSGKSVHF